MPRTMIISQGAAFMTDALTKNLTQSGFETVRVDPTLKAIEKERKNTDIYLMYAGDYVTESSDVLIYLKDICAEDEKSLCIIGQTVEIEAIRAVIPDTLISLEVTRPFDIKKFIEQFKTLAAVDEERKKAKHILLVDDDLTFLKLMRDWLSAKYNVTIVKSGMQAITYIANHTPDLIMLDYDMPITSGPQVMEMIRSESHSAQIPIIFLTGKSDKESVMSVMRLKPQGYLLKSMQRTEILAALDEFFETRKWKNVE